MNETKGGPPVFWAGRYKGDPNSGDMLLLRRLRRVPPGTLHL